MHRSTTAGRLGRRLLAVTTAAALSAGIAAAAAPTAAGAVVPTAVPRAGSAVPTATRPAPQPSVTSTPRPLTKPVPPAPRPVARAAGREFFGAHVGQVGYGDWPQVPRGSVGAIRLWDSGTTWREINPAPGVFQWSVLDAAVDNAILNGARVNLVLGTGPQWAAKDPWQWGAYGDGSASLPANESDWVAYVQAVAMRYKGRITAYETWNEGNLTLFWGGTASELARLNSLAYRTIKRIDPKAVVVAPSATLRGNGATWLSHYAQAGGFRYSDAINLHPYPKPEGRPEDGIVLMRRAVAVLASKGVTLPVWSTEINYGMPVGGKGGRYPLSTIEQSAFVSRTFLLALSDGVARTYWYSWSGAPTLSVQMTTDAEQVLGTPPTSRNAPPAIAWVVTEAWLRGGRMTPCTTDRSGTYSCTIAYTRGKGVVRWNPRANVSVVAPWRTGYRQDIYGRKKRTRAGERVRVGIAPVLFRTSK